MSMQMATESRQHSIAARAGSTLAVFGRDRLHLDYSEWLSSLLGSLLTVADTDASVGGLEQQLRAGTWSTVMVFVDGSLDGLRSFGQLVDAAIAGGVDRFVGVTTPLAAEAGDPVGAGLNLAERRTAGAAAEARSAFLSARLGADEDGRALMVHALLDGAPGEVLSAADPRAATIAPGGSDEIFVPTATSGVWRASVAPLSAERLQSLDSADAVVALAGPVAPASGMDVLLAPPVVGDDERALLVDALDSGWIAPAGPHLNQFESDLSAWVDDRDVVALSSGSAALHLALLVLGVEPGDDVVVQTSTFAATAFAVSHVGANPVFCDVDAATGNLDPDLLAELLAERSRTGRLPTAVVPVDLYGLCADYERIRAVCEPYGIPVVQDSAESLGSRAQGVAAGAHGDLGVLSFNGNKIITTSGGGALVGPAELVARARQLSTQAREPGLHYEHAEIGFNFRMSNLLAAVGRAQLASLDDRIAHRSNLYDRYRRALPELAWMPEGVTERWNQWLTVAFLPATVPPHFACRHLASIGVEARPFWKPMHRQPVFASAESWLNGRSDAFYATGICLPSGHGLDEASQDRVIEGLAALLVRSG